MLLLLFAVALCGGMYHDLKVRKDTRSSFLIESFGFGVGGTQNITTGPFRTEKGSASLIEHFCFVIKVTASDNSQFMDDNLHFKCTAPAQGDVVIPVSWDGSKSDIRVVKEKPKGYSNLYFVNQDMAPVSFDVQITQRSVGKNYLSIGELPLPMFYLIDAVVYLTLAGVWVFGALRPAKKVLLLHHLMTGMVVLKSMSVLVLSVDYHYRNITGHPGGWTVAYFALNAFRGIAMFCIIALIGTGWQFVKPFLTQKDKQIFLVVIPLQVLDNIALIVIEETIPGMRFWSTWKNVFRLVDILCCAAIIIPIVWSIKQLRDAAQTSGKAATNVHKLATFRNFYLVVVSYIYFTRIGVYLFEATLPFGSVWLKDLMMESATVALFVVVGYWFGPEGENPLLKVYESDEEVGINEFGELVVDLQAVAEKKKAAEQAVQAELQAINNLKLDARAEALQQQQSN